MNNVLGKMFNLTNFGVGITSGVIPSLVAPALIFGLRMSPFDDLFDVLRYMFIFFGVFITQFIGVSINDAKYKTDKSTLQVSVINTALISGLFIALHYIPKVGIILRTTKSVGWNSELIANLLTLGISSSFIFMMNNIIKDTPFLGGAVNNKYSMIISIIGLIGATYVSSMNHIYFTSNPIQYPLKKVLSKLPTPVRFATPIALQLVNPEILNQIQVDTPEQKETLELLKMTMNALLKSLPVDIHGSLQKVDSLIKKSPINLGVSTSDIIANISAVDIRQPGMIETVVKDPTVNLLMSLFKAIRSGDYLKVATTIPGGEDIINKGIASSMLEGGYY